MKRSLLLILSLLISLFIVYKLTTMNKKITEDSLEIPKSISKEAGNIDLHKINSDPQAVKKQLDDMVKKQEEEIKNRLKELENK